MVTLVLAPQTGRGLDGVCRTGRQRRWASSLLLGLSVVSFLAMAGELSGEASALLRRLGLDERVGPVFAREGIDGYSLPFVSVEDLVGVGVAAEDARRIVSAVAVPDAEPVEAVAVPSAPRDDCVMSTMKPRDVSAEVREKVGPLVDKLLQTDFARLSGKDQKKCDDAALRRAVQKEMRWPHPPGGRFLFQELQLG